MRGEQSCDYGTCVIGDTGTYLRGDPSTPRSGQCVEARADDGSSIPMLGRGIIARLIGGAHDRA